MKLDQIPVRQMKGVSAQKELELHAFGIHTIAICWTIFHFDMRIIEFGSLRKSKSGEKGDCTRDYSWATRCCSVTVARRIGLTCKVAVDGVLLTAVWFNRHFLQEQLTPGREIMLTGKWEQQRLQMTVSNSEFPDSGAAQAGTLQPVYSVGGSITQPWIRKMIGQALQQYGPMMEEMLPVVLMDKHELMPRREAVTAYSSSGRYEAGTSCPPKIGL